jgi:hypothetical protein
MAIARCEKCGCPPGRKNNIYSTIPHLPVGHPNSGVVCGTSECGNPGIIWLLDREERAYADGHRTFQLTGKYNFVKFFVQ